MELHSLRAPRCPSITDFVFGSRRLRVHDNGDRLALGTSSQRQFNPLRRQAMQADAGQIAARSPKLATNPLLTGSASVWNTTGSPQTLLRRAHRIIATFGHDEINLARDELRRQARQPIENHRRPAIFDRNIAAST